MLIRTKETAKKIVAAAIIRISAALVCAIGDAISQVTQVLAGPARGALALPAATRLAGCAGMVAAAAVRIIGLGVDTLIAAARVRRIGAAARAVEAGQVALARIVASAAVLLIVAGIDALSIAEDLVARAAALRLALPDNASAVAAAGPATAAAVGGVGFGVDTVLAAPGRAVLAFLRLLVLTVMFPGPGFNGNAQVGQAQRGQ
jgi:hypothetical protein